MTKIAAPTTAAIDEAARRLRAGGLVAFPTETVYGLGADTFRPRALHAVYAIKGRAADNPLIAHVAGAEGPAGAAGLVAAWNRPCAALAERFWPGPLTLVLEKSAAVPDAATAGRATIAVRAPRSPVAQALLEAFGGPISAPSANRSGRLSATCAEHVAEELAAAGDLLILDGGACEIGLESTVLDLSGAIPVILRPGSVSAGDLRAVLGPIEIRSGPARAQEAARARVELIEAAHLAAHLAALEAPAVVLCFDVRSVPSPHRALAMSRDAGGYARQLYRRLREAEAMVGGPGRGRIVIEAPPAGGGLWAAVRDRLERAGRRCRPRCPRAPDPPRAGSGNRPAGG